MTEDLGVFCFNHITGNKKVAIEISAEANITEVADAFRSFCLAVGYAESTVNEALVRDE